jgi:hypothetical protein
MKKQILLAVFALLITGLISVPVWAQLNTHSVWTFDGSGRQLTDPELSCGYTDFEKFRMITSWSEKTPGYAAQAHFRGVAVTLEEDPCGAHFYDFVLTRSSVTSFNGIEGDWDVYRDGVLMCGTCHGSVNGLSTPVGSYYKLTVDDPVYGLGAWFYSGYTDQRYGF